MNRKIIKTVGSVLCLGLAIAKVVGLFYVFTDPESTRELGWKLKQCIYTVSLLIYGIYLWLSRNSPGSDT